MKKLEAVNDFVVKFANVNGTGSSSANALFVKAVFRMGIPVGPRNIFPSNIQGLPTWYEVRISEKGYLGRRGGGRMRRRWRGSPFRCRGRVPTRRRLRARRRNRGPNSCCSTA